MGKGKDGGLECCKVYGAAGQKYLQDCSIEAMILIWLMVSGCAPALFGGWGRQKNKDSDDSNVSGKICGTIGFLFNLAWLICGSVWVYPTYGKVTAEDFNPCTGNVTTGCTKATQREE